MLEIQFDLWDWMLTAREDMPVVEVAGWPGSGKTTYLIELARNHPNPVIFVDCEGSIATRSPDSLPPAMDLYRIGHVHELIALLHQGKFSVSNALLCIDGIANLVKGAGLNAMQMTKVLTQLMQSLHKLVHQFQLQICISNTLTTKKDGTAVSSLGPVFSRFFDKHVRLSRSPVQQ